MVSLAKLFDAAGVSQADVARALEVSPVTVNDWVHGRSRVPPSRAPVLAALLGVADPADLPVSQAPQSGARAPGEPQSFLEWLVMSPGFSGHLGETYKERVRTLERFCLHPVEPWLKGRKRVPLPRLRTMTGRFWPGVGEVPFALAGETGVELVEAQAALEAIEDLADQYLEDDAEDLGVLSFDIVRQEVEKEATAFALDPTRKTYPLSHQVDTVSDFFIDMVERWGVRPNTYLINERRRNS